MLDQEITLHKISQPACGESAAAAQSEGIAAVGIVARSAAVAQLARHSRRRSRRSSSLDLLA